MSRRDYLQAVAIYLEKSSDVSAVQAVDVLGRLVAVDPEAFPDVVRGQDVARLVQHVLEPWDTPAPAWLLEADERAGVPAPKLVSVEFTRRQDTEWDKNAMALWEEHQTPASTRGLFPGPEWVASVSEEDFDALVAWAKTIPGYDEEDPPFVRREEETCETGD